MDVGRGERVYDGGTYLPTQVSVGRNGYRGRDLEAWGASVASAPYPMRTVVFPCTTLSPVVKPRRVLSHSLHRCDTNLQVPALSNSLSPTVLSVPSRNLLLLLLPPCCH
jgi:hypothetical protein